MKKLFALVLTLALSLTMLVGCGGNGTSSTNSNPTNSPASQGEDKDNTLPIGGNGGNDAEIVEPPADDIDEPETDADPGDADPSSTEIPVEVLEKIWVIDVNDTQKTKVTMDGGDGPVTYDLTVTLKLSVSKAAQNSPLGKYAGTATLKYYYKLNEGAYGGNADGGGSDPNARIKLENLDLDKYATDPTDELAPLPRTDKLPAYVKKFETMAIGAFNMNGDGKVYEWAGESEWRGGGGGTQDIYYRLGIENGIVSVELPKIAPGVLFMGTLSFKPQ